VEIVFFLEMPRGVDWQMFGWNLADALSTWLTEMTFATKTFTRT
jgi:hypothetical protein